MGDRPQGIINSQLVESADLLIAIFWTRIGTPTGVAVSGTAEEITKHLDAGKPAMIYHSTSPVHPDSVDHTQYEEMKKFLGTLRARGLVQSYDSVARFRPLLSRHLTQQIIKAFPRSSAVAAPKPTGGTSSEPASDVEGAAPQERAVRQPVMPISTPPTKFLSKAAQTMLIAAAESKDGAVLMLRTMGGTTFQANNQRLNQAGNPRDEARWREALNELLVAGLVEARGTKGEIFDVTHRGYEMADDLIDSRAHIEFDGGTVDEQDRIRAVLGKQYNGADMIGGVDIVLKRLETGWEIVSAMMRAPGLGTGPGIPPVPPPMDVRSAVVTILRESGVPVALTREHQEGTA